MAGILGGYFILPVYVSVWCREYMFVLLWMCEYELSMWVSPWSQRSVLGLLQSISTLIFEMCSLTLLAVIYPARPDRLVCAWGYVSASSLSRVLLVFVG